MILFFEQVNILFFSRDSVHKRAARCQTKLFNTSFIQTVRNPESNVESNLKGYLNSFPYLTKKKLRPRMVKWLILSQQAGQARGRRKTPSSHFFIHPLSIKLQHILKQDNV